MAFIILGGIALGSYVGTLLMVRFPGGKIYLEKLLIETYAYLDRYKSEVPPEAIGIWTAAYEFCDSTLLAIDDGKLTWAESRKAGLQIIVLVNEVRKIINK